MTARLGAMLDFLTQMVFLAVLLGICGVAEWVLVPAACWSEGPAGGALTIAVLTLAGLGAILLCCPRRLP